MNQEKTVELSDEAIDRAALVDGLKVAAICNTSHPALAATALIRAAADILALSFGPVETCDMIRRVTDEALLLGGETGAAVGHA